MQTYQAEVKSAIQQNDADKAKALYAAWKEQQAKIYAEEQAKKLAEEQAKALAAKQAKTPYKRKKRSPEPEKPPETATDSAYNELVKGLETIGTKDARFAAIEQAYKEGLLTKAGRDGLVYRYTR